MSAGLWLLFWVGLFGALGSGQGAYGFLRGAGLGVVVWVIFGFFAFVWSAMSTNYCVEYGYPDLHDTREGKSCTDEEIREHIEKTQR